MSEPTPEALRAIRAWYRLQRATGALSAHIRREIGLTGEQLALLRIVAERESWPLAELRARLTMHPATLGQALGRLSDRGLVALVQQVISLWLASGYRVLRVCGVGELL